MAVFEQKIGISLAMLKCGPESCTKHFLSHKHLAYKMPLNAKCENAKVRIGRCIKCEIKMRKISHFIRVAEKCIKCEMQKCENAKLVSVLSM